MIQFAQIIFILSVLVILHEFGHYITAKMFKMRVEKFYLFMDAGFALVKKKIGETEWGIGWLPLGGYVKISGMIDESMDTEQMQSEPQPWEFRSKPAWQRLIVMLGGIIVNILLAWLIYTVMYASVGQKYISSEKLQQNGLAFGEVGEKVGFKNGDKIISVDGKLQPKFNWLIVDVLLSNEVVVERDGKQVKLHLTDEQIGEILGSEGKNFVKPRFEISEGITIDSISSKSTFKVGDQIKGIKEQKFIYFDQIKDYLKANKNKSVDFVITRNAKDTVISVPVNKEGSIGIGETVFPNMRTRLLDVYVQEVESGSNAEKAGLQNKDGIVGVQGQKIKTLNEFTDYLKLNKNKDIILQVVRDGVAMDVVTKVNEKGKLGIMFNALDKKQYQVINHLSISEAIPAAINESWQMLVYNVKQFKLILKPKTGAYKQIKSPIGIARQLPETWDWEFVWNFTALFSIGLAFMNLLPIPGLDGGHALFTLVEMITGKKLSDKAAGYVQTAGMVILLTLMAFTFGKDIYQWIMDVLAKK